MANPVKAGSMEPVPEEAEHCPAVDSAKLVQNLGDDSYACYVNKVLRELKKSIVKVEGPALDVLVDMSQAVMDTAAAAATKKQHFRRLRRLAKDINSSCRMCSKDSAVKNVCGQTLSALHKSLTDALNLSRQYAKTDSWVDKKVQGGRKGFDSQFEEIFERVKGGGTKLAATIKVVQDAVKEGHHTQALDRPDSLESDPGDTTELEEAEKVGRAEEASRLDVAAASQLDEKVLAKVRDAAFLTERKATMDAESEGGDDAATSIATSASHVDNIRVLRDEDVKERRSSTRPKSMNALGYAFIGDFRSCVQVADDEGDGSQLNKPGQTYACLHQAVFWEDLEGLISLISRGAHVDIKTQKICPTLQVAKGSTPIHLAAIIGNEKIVKQLICDGADFGLQDEDKAPNTPLDVVGTEQCREAISTASALRDLQAEHVRLAKDGQWDKAIDIIYRGLRSNMIGLPSNVVFPEGHYSIHEAVRQGDVEAYANLVFAGALPLLRTRVGTCAPAPGSAPWKLPSEVCDETAAGRAIKDLIVSIEAECLTRLKKKPSLPAVAEPAGPTEAEAPPAAAADASEAVAAEPAGPAEVEAPPVAVADASETVAAEPAGTTEDRAPPAETPPVEAAVDAERAGTTQSSPAAAPSVEAAVDVGPAGTAEDKSSPAEAQPAKAAAPSSCAVQ